MSHPITQSPSNVRAPSRSGEPLPHPRRVVLVGEHYEIAHAMQHLALSSGTSLFTVVGAVPFAQGQGGFPEEAIRRLVAEEQADTLMLAGAMSRSALVTFGEFAVVLGCRLLSLVPETNGTALNPVLVWEGNSPYLEFGLVSDRRRFDRFKRWFDAAVSAVVLLGVLPVLVLAALAIRIESAGSPFFGHVRIGRGGRRFRCWKLRTMRRDAEGLLSSDADLQRRYRANDFKLPDDEDPRITRIGRFLRKTSLDELPQLWNVLQGDMSLVGPRPIVADELPHYRGEVLTLLSVRPGITGAWAVNGRHHLAYPRRAEVELAYVRSRSVLTDFGILLRTVSAVLDPGFGLRRL